MSGDTPLPLTIKPDTSADFANLRYVDISVDIKDDPNVLNGKGLYIVGHRLPNVEVWTSSHGNFEIAYAKRVVPAIAARAERVTDHDALINEAYEHIKTKLTHKLLSKHADMLFDVENMVSAKWSEKRFYTALVDVLTTYSRHKLSRKYKAFIKREVSDFFKAKPRVVVDIGDVRQLMALAMACVLEHALFDLFGRHAIKYNDRQKPREPGPHG